ncbi:MAG: hypothetical protein IJ043_03535 [Clostridia bacterium]|nr:hypothetical protein [Clostridia bacterium]
MKKLVVLSAACGVGKTTIKNALNECGISDRWACIDTDEVGINWWHYAGTENEAKFSDDCLAEAVKMSGDKDLLFTTCLNPGDFYQSIHLPQSITSTFLIGMTCSDEEIIRRLKARPAERMCGSDEFIAGQIQYNNWFKKNAGKFQFYLDNTNKTVHETAEEIAGFLKEIE